MDFSDGKIPSLDQHPDIVISGNGPGHLQRNKTERRRLQGLQRSNTNTARPVTPYVPRTTLEKFNLWMINEGGRRLFFFTFLFLHALVIAFGFMHYQLKDSSVTARATFGITFRESTFPLVRSRPTQHLLTSLRNPKLLPVRLRSSSTSMSRSSSSRSAATSSRSSAGPP